MSLSRREFIHLTCLALGGAAVAACEQEPSENYQAYLDHLQRLSGKDYLVTGGEMRYEVFSEKDFELLDRAINSSLMRIGWAPEPIDWHDMEKEDIHTRFDTAIRNLGAEPQFAYEHGLYKSLILYNPNDLRVEFNPGVVDSLLDWAKSQSIVAPAWYPGSIDHSILLGSFYRNPFFPKASQSATVVFFDEEKRDKWRIVQTIINLYASNDIFEHLNPDWDSAIEIMQANLGIGGLRQEELANSIGLAYVYAKR